MDVDAYLHRIGANRPTDRSAADLAALHRAHLLAVPFEDLDIHRGVPIDLDLDALYDKIVRRRRGGFCYENNGLFAALLTALDFDVTLVSAFRLDDDGSCGPEFDHLRLLVNVGGQRWLADVGNGGGFLDPLPLHPSIYGVHRMHRDGELWWTEHCEPDGDWRRSWAWTLKPRALAEFTDRCRYQEHHPDSHFLAYRMCLLPTEAGRIAMVNGVLTRTVDGGRTERSIHPAEEPALLAELFGVVITDGARGCNEPRVEQIGKQLLSRAVGPWRTRPAPRQDHGEAERPVAPHGSPGTR